MKRFISVSILALCVFGISSVSMARQRTINQREHHQQQRIGQGIRSGELTRREARRLEAQEARIRVDERFARRDGYVSPRERARLNRELDRSSRNIYHQKHDGQDRNP